MKKLTELQDELDLVKWQESERQGKDMCGSFPYCAYCDKLETTPCAKAFNRMSKASIANKKAIEVAEKPKRKTCKKK